MPAFNSTRASHSKRQHGAALVTTLLIVALIVVTVTAMTAKQQHAIQLAQNRQTQLQLKNLLSAGEKFAMAVLRRDKVEGERGETDSTEDYWAQSLPPVPVDGATVEGCVVDLQGKFNLNNLAQEDRASVDVEFRILQQLLTALTIDVVKADAIRDWIDPDIEVTVPDGAEDDFYTGQSPSYRAANGPMVSPSELLLVKGFRVSDEGGLEDYDLLLQHVSTLPRPTPINVNTASEAVLSAIAPHIAASASLLKVAGDESWEEYPGCPPGDLLEDEEPVDPANVGAAIYENTDSFIDQASGTPEERQILEELRDNATFDKSSNFYMSRVTVSRDEISITQYSIFERDNNGAVRTVRRSRGAL